MFRLLTFPFRLAAKTVMFPFKAAALPVKAATYPFRHSKKKHYNKQDDLTDEEALLFAILLDEADLL